MVFSAIREFVNIVKKTLELGAQGVESPTISASPPEMKKRKQIAGESSSSRKSLKVTIKQKEIIDAEKDDVNSEDRLKPGSHKENPEVVDDDDDNARETKDDTMGSLEFRNEETQTTISTPIRSPRKSLSSDKKFFQKLTDTVFIPPTTTSKHSHVKKRISNKCSHLPGALRRMCRRQGYMIQDMERKCVTTKKFWKTHNKVDQVLKEVIPKIAENAVNDLIEYNLKPCIAETIIEDRGAFRSDIFAFVSQEFRTHAPKIITKLFKEYMKSSLQDRADNITLWEALRSKFEKSLTSNTSCREDGFHSHHDEYQDDDAPPEGEKRVKRSKKSKRSKSARGSSSKHSRKDSIAYNVDKRVPTIFDHARMKATLKDFLSNMSRNPEEYACHLEQSTSFMENQIYGNTEEKKYILSLHKFHAEEFPEPDLEEKLNRWVRKEFKTFNEDARKNPEDYYSNHRITEVVRIVTDQPHGLDFMEQILEIDNRKIKLMNSLITFIRSCVIWERVHDFQLGIESYQMKVNLTAPTIKFHGIEEHASYTIVDELQMGLIYLNSKDDKRVMYLEEIVKFCDATLEKVLNEVKLRMFESKFLKKPPLLGEFDQDIMKAYEREISKRPSHQQQMRRWESFVNGRLILPTMKRL
ncbi:hypothetical protein Tco_1429389 [Tanacetum coccineum]